MVFSTLIGDSAVAFYEQFHRYGLAQPLCSPITAETEIQAMDIARYNKNIFSSFFPYFKTVDSPANQAFIEAYKKRFRSDTISSVMQNTYNSIYLLSDALKKTRRLTIDSIRRELNSAAFDSPQGYIRFDENNHHLWQCARIGHVTEQGEFEIVWESKP
ncbi:transporter substrate-binding protein [Terrilactibacillus sp. S3-3]|nr:transporter substrate-binding protein [Terrilactibacillus sp. S3-3]